MKNKRSLLGILVLVIGFGMLLSCDIDGESDDDNKSFSVDNKLNGTWVTNTLHGHLNEELILNNGYFESSSNGFFNRKGTYTTSGEIFTWTNTHLHGDLVKDTSWQVESKWYTKNEWENATSWSEALLNNYFGTWSIIYSVSANTLTLGLTTYTMK